MKKRSCLIAVFCLTLSLLAGCRSSAEAAPTATALPVINAVEVTKATTPTVPEMTEPKTTAPTEPKKSFEAQFTILAENAPMWLQQEEKEPTWYAVTDLDGNGQLEIIASVCRGTGLFSTSNFYEVNESKGTLEPLLFDMGESDSQPDLIYGAVEYWVDDAESVTWYIFTDALRNGPAEHDEVRFALSKWGSGILAEPICSKHTAVSNNWGDMTDTFFDGNGNEISYNDYSNLPAARFPGCRHGLRAFGWFTPEAGNNLTQLIRDSYQAFAEENSIG